MESILSAIRATTSRLDARLFATAFGVVLAAGVVMVSSASATTGTLIIATDTVLTQDHEGTVIVAGDNVTLDCAGHTVSGDGTGIGINDLADGVSVTNCQVQNFGIGILATGHETQLLGNVVTHVGHGIQVASLGGVVNCAGQVVSGDGGGVGINVLADAVSVTNCQVQSFETGILATGHATQILGNVATGNGQGIRLAEATGDTVSGNSANNNSFWGIIAAQGSSNNTISHNTAEMNRIVGMTLNDASSNRFIDNVSAHNGSGFGIGFSSDFNTISHNVATNNTHTGFDFLMANNNAIDGNVSVHNGSGPNGGGYSFNNSSDNTVTNNIAMHNGSSGFNVFFGSELNLFTRNHACQNYYGDAFDSSTGGGNTWTGNHFCNSTLS